MTGSRIVFRLILAAMVAVGVQLAPYASAAPAEGGVLCAVKRLLNPDPAPYWVGNPRVIEPGAYAPQPSYRCGARTTWRDAPPPEYPWGQFGARYGTTRSAFKGYYGDYHQLKCRRGY